MTVKISTTLTDEQFAAFAALQADTGLNAAELLRSFCIACVPNFPEGNIGRGGNRNDLLPYMRGNIIKVYSLALNEYGLTGDEAHRVIHIADSADLELDAYPLIRRALQLIDERVKAIEAEYRAEGLPAGVEDVHIKGYLKACQL